MREGDHEACLRLSGGAVVQVSYAGVVAKVAAAQGMLVLFEGGESVWVDERAGDEWWYETSPKPPASQADGAADAMAAAAGAAAAGAGAAAAAGAEAQQAAAGAKGADRARSPVHERLALGTRVSATLLDEPARPTANSPGVHHVFKRSLT